MKNLIKKLVITIIILSNIIIVDAQWIPQTSGTTNIFEDVYFPSTNIGYIVGYNGTIRKTTDGGTTWVAQTSGITNSISSVTFINDTIGYFAGSSGEIYKTINGGTTWSSQTSGTTELLLCIYFLNSETGFVCGSNGLILKTINGGTTWVAQTSGATVTLFDIFFTNDSTGFITTMSGTILKTTNGGISWVSQNSGVSDALVSIQFTNENTGYALARHGKILKTNNGGIDWFVQYNYTLTNYPNLFSLFFADDTTGYVVEGHSVLKTENGGTTWNIQSVDSYYAVFSVFFTNKDTGIVCGSYGKIFKTINGGWCTRLPGAPSGSRFVCNPSGSYNYTTSGAPYATSYSWSITPTEAGTISGTGTTASVIWSSIYSGNATIKVQGVRSGCTGEYSSTTVLVSNTPLSSFSLSLPGNGLWVTTTPLFQWNSSTGALYYSLYVDGVLKKDSISGLSYQIPVNEAINNGMHTWYIVANNGCTMPSNEIRSFLIDYNLPSSFNLLTPPNDSWTSDTTPTFSWAPSIDAQSGVAYYQLWIDGVLINDSILSTSIESDTALTNGPHTWEVKAIDHAGNVRNSNQIFTIKVDNKPPGNGSTTCLYFDGTGTSVSVPDHQSLHLSPNYTIEAWINFQGSVSGSPMIISKQQSDQSTGDYKVYLTYFGTGNKLGFAGNGGIYALSDTSLYQNIWYHIAFVYTGSQIKIYINGLLDTIRSVNGVHTPSTTNITFGRKGGENNDLNKYKGYLDEVRFWNVARTQTQIYDNKDVVISGNTPGLVGYWRFNEGVSDSLTYDISNNNNGTLNGPLYQNSTLEASANHCALVYPSHKEYIKTQNPTFIWNTVYDTGIGFVKYQLWLDGILVQDHINDTTWTLLNPLSYGEHTWSVQCYDSLNNIQPGYQRTFYIDYASPNPFNLTSPLNNEVVMFPTPNFSWQPTSDSIGGCGLRKYQLCINGEVNRDSISINTTTVSPSTILQQGVYSWFIKAYDNVGNVRQSTETRTFYIDWEAPTSFELIAPTDTQTLLTSSPTFNWHSSSDSGSGLSHYEITISGYQPIVVLPTDTSHHLTFHLPNGNYSWFVRAYDMSGSFGSSNINSFTINVPLPEQPAVPTGLNALCRGSQTTTYTTIGANYADQYVWELTPDTAGTITGTGLTSIVTWNETFSGTAQITVTGQNYVGLSIESLPFTVTLNDITLPNLVSESSNICLGQPTDTMILTNYSGSILKWQKRFNSGIWYDINDTNSTFFEIPDSTGLYQYRAVLQNDICPFLNSEIASVSVGDIPANAEIISGNETVCQGESSIVYSIPAISNALSYLWTLPTGATGTSSTNSITVSYGTTAVSGNISVKGSNDCGEGDISTKAITVKNRSTYTIDTTVCNSYIAPDEQIYTTSGTQTAIIPNVAGCDSTITINLTVNQSSSSTINETVCDSYNAPDGQIYTTSGTKTAIIQNAVGCDSVITINLIVNTTPETPTISLEEDRLISSSVLGNQWYNQNGMIPNETNQELVLTENGTYFVIVTQNDCPSDSSNIILVDNVLVKKFDKSAIIINPNPFTDQLFIKNLTTETYQYYMYNGIGQILFNGNLESEVLLNTSDLAKGLYIMKFVNSLGQVYYKVVKQ